MRSGILRAALTQLSASLSRAQGNPLARASFKAHDKPILWTAHHPKEQQLITASSDGTVKVWGVPPA